jgi:predicted transcriptional regulator
MAILKAAPKPPKNETLQLRVEEEIKSKLAKYAEFIDSSESYVVSEALKLVFRKDDEFRVWLDEHNNHDDHSRSNGAPFFETVGKA